VVLTIGHALRAHEALSRPDALPGFLEVVHRLVKDGVFVGHERSIRVGILRRVDGPGYPSGCPGFYNALGRAISLTCFILLGAAFALRPSFASVARDLRRCDRDYPRWGAHTTESSATSSVLDTPAFIGSELTSYLAPVLRFALPQCCRRS
jgi:hypothetical protein